jgi:hypothetical protein
MLCGPHPALAVRYISEYQLFNTIFQLPDPSTNSSSTETVVKVPALHEHQLGTPMAAARLVRLVHRFLLSEDDQAQDGIVGNENWDAEELASAISVYQQSLIFRRSMNLLHSSKVLLYLAATLIPYRNQLVVMGRQQSSQKPPITIPGPLYIAKNSLKFPNSDCESVARLLWSVDVLIDWAHRRRESFTTINQTKTDHSIEQYKQLRHDLAVLVRDLAGIGIGHGNVDIPILFAAVVDYAVSTYPAENAASSDYGADEALADYGEFAVRLMPYLELAAQIERMGVQNAASEQPLLNGNEVVAYLRAKGTSNQVRPGKWLGQVLERMLEWQFREGAAATKPGALAIVDQAWEDGTIPRQFH